MQGFLVLGCGTSMLGLLALLRFALEAFSFAFLVFWLDLDDLEAFESSLSLSADISGCKSDY